VSLKTTQPKPGLLKRVHHVHVREHSSIWRASTTASAHSLATRTSCSVGSASPHQFLRSARAAVSMRHPRKSSAMTRQNLCDTSVRQPSHLGNLPQREPVLARDADSKIAALRVFAGKAGGSSHVSQVAIHGRCQASANTPPCSGSHASKTRSRFMLPHVGHSESVQPRTSSGHSSRHFGQNQESSTNRICFVGRHPWGQRGPSLVAASDITGPPST
jgi:CDGSH-type Zn-finger protein